MQRVPKMLHWHLLHPSLKTTAGYKYNVCHFFALENCSHSIFARDMFVLQTMMIWLVSRASDILTCAPMSRPTFWCLLHKLQRLSRTWRERKIFSALSVSLWPVTCDWTFGFQPNLKIFIKSNLRQGCTSCNAQVEVSLLAANEDLFSIFGDFFGFKGLRTRTEDWGLFCSKTLDFRNFCCGCLYYFSDLLVQAPPFLVHWQVLHLNFSIYFCAYRQ